MGLWSAFHQTAGAKSAREAIPHFDISWRGQLPTDFLEHPVGFSRIEQHVRRDPVLFLVFPAPSSRSCFIFDEVEWGSGRLSIKQPDQNLPVRP